MHEIAGLSIKNHEKEAAIFAFFKIPKISSLTKFN